MGDLVNVLIDDLHALLYRLLGLPMAFQLILWLSVWAIILLLTFRLIGQFKVKELPLRTRYSIYSFSSLSIILLVISIVYDHHRFLDEQERSLKRNQAVREPTAEERHSAMLSDRLRRFESMGFADSLEIRLLQHENGIDVFQLSFKKPLIEAFIAFLDLNEFNVVLDTAITKKEKTSQFAKRLQATVAVNGEAGASPGLFAPLGKWTGNYMCNGRVIKLEDGPDRPFVWFNKKGLAHYSRESELIKLMPADAINAIWGRFDLLWQGNSAISEKDLTRMNYYPRTIVGMDKGGSEMILLVVDGRRPLYSRGMKMNMCAETMLAAGAWNAMACDQGGSSEMWTKALGVVNRPADGAERPVYTHLGFKPKKR